MQTDPSVGFELPQQTSQFRMNGECVQPLSSGRVQGCPALCLVTLNSPNAYHGILAYPPKAPIQGARKMAPEGGLPEILLPYIAFCFDPRYARNEGP